MDIGPPHRPVASVGATVRTEPLPSPDTVPTELPPVATVTAATETPPARLDVSRSAARLQEVEALAQEAIKRNLLVDPDTRQVVYKAVDTRSGVVIEQIPDEALLKLRAYVRANRDAHDSGRTAEKTA
jgi:flagellar protein FlaG